MDDEYNDDNRKDDSRTDELRCNGHRCGDSRNHIAGADIDNDFKSILDNYGKRYRINNELDAIVLDVDKLENVLPTLEMSDNSKSEERKDDLRKLKQTEPNKPKTIFSKVPSYRSLSSTGSSTAEAPFTLPMELGEEVPFKLNERLITFSDFITFMRQKHKTAPVDKALNYIKDPRTVGSWNEHFTKAGIKINDEDEKYLKKLRNYYHNFVMPPKENYLPYVEKLLKNQLGINKIEVVPGLDDKAIVPASLYFELLKLKNKLKADKNKPKLRSEKKRLLPLTMKQKMRLHLQQGNGDKERVLAPFVLDVKGLGQANH